MLKKISLLLLVFLTLTKVNAAQVNKFTVFGDSLSDNGNIYQYSEKRFPPSPPYFKGRFSNGYVWIEWLMQKYYPRTWRKRIFDYAFGGAGVDLVSKNDQSHERVSFSLGSEVASYLLAHNDRADANSLYAVWIGSNNYIASNSNPVETAAMVNAGIKQELEILANKGARHILVVNLPDMGRSPFAKMTHSEELLSYCSRLHNDGLSKMLAELRVAYPEVQWLLYDAAATFADVMQNPVAYGFINTTAICPFFENPSSFADLDVKDTSFVLKMTTSLSAAKDVCDGYFFFDPVHPTTLTHKTMADMLANFLQDAGIEFV